MNDEKFSGNLSRLDEAIPSVALFHVVDVARFMCASLTRVFQRESLSLSSLSLSLSLSSTLSLFLSWCPSSPPLSRLHPQGSTTHTTSPSFHLVPHLSSTPG